MTSNEWGRVADDGTVFLKTADGERTVGQVPDRTPEEALRFFTDRYEALAGKVALHEQRVHAGLLSPDQAAADAKTLRGEVTEAAAVGDLPALAGRLDALLPVIAAQRTVRKEERAKQQAESKVAKEALVAEAEKIAAGKDWRHGVNRMRELLEQ